MNYLISIIILSFTFHPVHISFTNLELDNENNEIVIMSRIFMDDIQKATEISQNVEIDINNLDDSTNLNPLIDYYHKRFNFYINEEKINPEKIKFKRYDINQASDIAIRLFFSYKPKNDKISKIKVNNKILTDIYPDQSNLMIVKIYDTQESFRLTPDKNEVTLSLQ